MAELSVEELDELDELYEARDASGNPTHAWGTLVEELRKIRRIRGSRRRGANCWRADAAFGSRLPYVGVRSLQTARRGLGRLDRKR